MEAEEEKRKGGKEIQRGEKTEENIEKRRVDKKNKEVDVYEMNKSIQGEEERRGK